jgi:hypothetical protein
MSKDIYFRSSASGKIMTNGQGTVVTEKQMETIKDYETRLREGGKLTDKQKSDLKDYKAKRDAPFELSPTAKQAVEDVWLFREKGFYKQIDSKYLNKGLFGEDVGMSLLTEIDGRYYSKNTERVFKNNRTGEWDNKFTLNGKKIIQDVKCCWDSKTFKNSDMDSGYIWQGRDYMDLGEADEFWLRYCLVDCPPHLVAREKEYEWRKYHSNEMSDEERQSLEERMKPIFDQIDRNLVYSTNEAYTVEERVKTFRITRDDLIHKQYLDRIPHCLDYYKTIKLNDGLF